VSLIAATSQKRAVLAVGGIALALAALILVAGAGPTDAREPAPVPPPKALEQLKEMGEALDQADDVADKAGHAFFLGLKRAEDLKARFLGFGFRGQQVFGCGLAELLRRLDNIDRSMAIAQDASGPKRSNHLHAASHLARNLATTLEGCPGAGEREPGIAKAIRARIDALQRLYVDDRLSDRKLDDGVEDVSKRKRKILKDQQVYGCQVVDFFVLVERIDVALVFADERLDRDATHEQKSRIIEKRKKWLRSTEKALVTLTRKWELVPCGGTVPPPPTPPPNQPPVITAFTAVFPDDPCDTCTGYTVEATDENPGTLTYTWSKRPPDGATNPEHTNCGTFTPNSPTPPEAIWDHPNGAPTDTPPGCDHPATKHPGWITVVVTDAQGVTASCTYKSGSAPTSTSDPATNCT
jgi:hypothetical protein